MKNQKSYIGFLILLTVSNIYAARPVTGPKPTNLSAYQKLPKTSPNLAQLRERSASGSLSSKQVAAPREKSEPVNKQLTRDDVINNELTRISNSLKGGSINDKAAVEVLVLQSKISRMPLQKDQKNKKVLEDWVVAAGVQLKGKKDYKELAKDMGIELPAPLRPAPKPPVARSFVAPEPINSVAPVAKPVEAVPVVSQTKRSFISSLVPRFNSSKKYKPDDFKENGQFQKDLIKDLEKPLKREFPEKLSDKDVKYINDIKTKLENYEKGYINNKIYDGIVNRTHETIIRQAKEKLQFLLEKVAAKKQEKAQKEFQKQEKKMVKEQEKEKKQKAELDRITVKILEKSKKEIEALKKQADERKTELVNKGVKFDS